MIRRRKTGRSTVNFADMAAITPITMMSIPRDIFLVDGHILYKDCMFND